MSRLFRNIAYNIAGQGLVLLLGFIGVKFIFTRLGGDAFGIIYFTQVLTGVLTTALELGVLATIVREVSAHYFTDRRYVEDLIRTASTFYWGVGLILFLAVFSTAPLLVQHWINLRTIPPQTATTMLRFLSLTTLIMLPRALYSALFQGRQRMELNNSIDVTSSAIQQLGIIFILARGGDAFAAVQWIATAAVLSTLAYITVASRLYGWRALAPGYIDAVVRRNIRFTGHMGALSFLNMALIQFDKVVASKLLPIATVGYYSFASTVVIRMSFAVAAIGQAALPSFSSLKQTGDSRGLLAQYRKLQDLLAFGIVPVLAALSFAAIPLFTYIFNHDIAWLLLLPTVLLCVGFFMYASVNVPYTFSVALGRPDIASRAYVVALLLAAPVTTVTIYFFSLTGAATWWIAYHLVLYAYMIPRICRECLHVSTSGWYLHIARVLGLTAITYGSVWWLIAVPRGYSTVALVVAYVIATLVFLTAAFWLIGPELRETLVAVPRRLVVSKATRPA